MFGDVLKNVKREEFYLSVTNILEKYLSSPNFAERLAFPIKKDNSKEGHAHVEVELTFQLEGPSDIIFSDEVMTIKAGQLAIIPAFLGHEQKSRKVNGKFSTLVINLFGSSYYVQLASNRFSTGRIADRFKDFEVHVFEELYSDRVDSAFYKLFPGLFEQSFSSLQMKSRALEGALQLYLVELYEMIKNNLIANSSFSLITRTCLQRITTQFMDPALNVKSLAKVCKCTPNYLSAVFHRETGKRFIEMLNEKRVEHAAKLLKKTNNTLDEVAQAVGYDSATYFIRQFKRFYGMTPAKYRIQI